MLCSVASRELSTNISSSYTECRPKFYIPAKMQIYPTGQSQLSASLSAGLCSYSMDEWENFGRLFFSRLLHVGLWELSCAHQLTNCPRSKARSESSHHFTSQPCWVAVQLYPSHATRAVFVARLTNYNCGSCTSKAP